MASGHVSRIKRPNTWLHRPMLQNVKKALANSEPSTIGTNRTSSDVRLESAFGGRAENICSQRVFRLLTLNRHGAWLGLWPAADRHSTGIGGLMAASQRSGARDHGLTLTEVVAQIRSRRR